MTPLQKNIASACASVLFCAVSAGIFIFFAQSVARASAARSAIASRISILAHERAAAGAAKRGSEARAADIERIRGFFVRRDQPIAFVEQLEAMAKRTGNSVALDVDESSGAGGDLVFRITLRGTRATVVRFIRALEAAPHLTRVEEMHFQDTGGEEIARSAGPEADARLLLKVRVKTQ